MVGISIFGCRQETVYIDQNKTNAGKVETVISSSDTSLNYNQGVEYHQQGNLEKAITKYRETIDADPKHVGAYLNLGTIYYN